MSRHECNEAEKRDENETTRQKQQESATQKPAQATAGAQETGSAQGSPRTWPVVLAFAAVAIACAVHWAVPGLAHSSVPMSNPCQSTPQYNCPQSLTIAVSRGAVGSVVAVDEASRLQVCLSELSRSVTHSCSRLWMCCLPTWANCCAQE